MFEGQLSQRIVNVCLPIKHDNCVQIADSQIVSGVPPLVLIFTYILLVSL